MMSTFVFVSLLPILLSLMMAGPLFCLCLEVTQQSLERLLIRLRICPVRKVANMACATQFRGPCLVRLHHALVKAYRKEHFPLLALLFFQRRFDLIFDPRTG